MKLTDLNACLIDNGRELLGVQFLCPHCKLYWLVIKFKTPIQFSDAPADNANRYMSEENVREKEVEGRTLDDLSTIGKVEFAGHWRGRITLGKVVT